MKAIVFVGTSPDGFITRADGVIERLVISRIPTLIGSGIPLFGPTEGDIALEHVATRVYATGLVQSEYAVRLG